MFGHTNITIHSFYTALFFPLEQTHCAHRHVILNEWLHPFIARIINIHGSGVLVALCECYMAGATWNAAVSAQVLCTPFSYTPYTRWLADGRVVVECCFTSTETVGLLGTGAEDGHLDFHTAPELWWPCIFYPLFNSSDSALGSSCDGFAFVKGPPCGGLPSCFFVVVVSQGRGAWLHVLIWTGCELGPDAWTLASGDCAWWFLQRLRGSCIFHRVDVELGEWVDCCAGGRTTGLFVASFELSWWVKCYCRRSLSSLGD